MSVDKRYTRQSITRAFAEELIASHKGNKTQASRAIQPECFTQYGERATVNAVRQWLSEAVAGDLKQRVPSIYEPEDASKLNQIKNALEEANIPIDAIGKFQNVRVRSGFHEGLTKDDDGEPVVTKLSSKSISFLVSPKWAAGPEWPVVQPAPMVNVKPTPRTRPDSTVKTIVVISDTQIGFMRRIDTGEMVPIHDPRAIDLALQIVADVQPDQIGYVGDFLDLAEMSRWLQLPEFQRTTQAALDEGGVILDKFEAAAGPRDKRLPTQFIAGNHDRRLQEYIVKNAMAAYGLKQDNTPPESWPSNSIQHLLQFDRRGIEYCGEYPGGEWWIAPTLVVRHNPESKDAYDASVIAGHTHRIDRTTYSRRTQFGSVERTLWEIGCLCSLENFPDSKSLAATAVPSNRGFVKNWSQGFAIVHIDKDGDFLVEQVEIKRSPKGLKAIRPGGRIYAA